MRREPIPPCRRAGSAGVEPMVGALCRAPGSRPGAAKGVKGGAGGDGYIGYDHAFDNGVVVGVRAESGYGPFLLVDAARVQPGSPERPMPAARPRSAIAWGSSRPI